MEQKLVCGSPLGPLVIEETDGAITALHLETRDGASEIPEAETPLLLEAKKQLAEYFRGARKAFELPLKLYGTAFQRKVWEALLTIPYGDTWSYRQVAGAIGNPKACRAVGNANSKNPIMIIVPCHRVIAADGSLGGYTGGLSIKTALLELEHFDSPSG